MAPPHRESVVLEPIGNRVKGIIFRGINFHGIFSSSDFQGFFLEKIKIVGQISVNFASKFPKNEEAREMCVIGGMHPADRSFFL